MKRMLRWAGYMAGTFLVFLASIGTIGALQPVAHEATESETFPVPAGRLWDLSIALFERTNDGSYAIVERETPHRLVTAIVDRHLPFAGSWTYEFTPDGAGTRLTITERGEVYNPFFRFISRFVIGNPRSLHDFFSTLQRETQPAQAATS